MEVVGVDVVGVPPAEGDHLVAVGDHRVEAAPREPHHVECLPLSLLCVRGTATDRRQPAIRFQPELREVVPKEKE